MNYALSPTTSLAPTAALTPQALALHMVSPHKMYIKNGRQELEVDNSDTLPRELTMDFLALFRVDEVTFEDKAPRKEALENVISTMNMEGVNFVYLILGDRTGVSFYYGVARDFSCNTKQLEIAEFGRQVLMRSLQGNFRGSVISEADPDERERVLETLENLAETKVLEGVPGINKDDEKYQSIDRLIDIMVGEEFALMLIAKPMAGADINQMQEALYNLYNNVSRLSKCSLQFSQGTNRSYSVAQNTGSSHTDGTNKGSSETRGDGEGYYSRTTNEGESHSDTRSSGTTKTGQVGDNQGTSTSVELVNKQVQDWLKYMDEVVLPRLDYGLGRGLFVTSTVLLGHTPAALIKLESAMKSVYGGESGNRLPLHAFAVSAEEAALYKRLQIPVLRTPRSVNVWDQSFQTSHSHYFTASNRVLLGNWMSAREISLLAGLPQKEVIGLTLKEEVEFGFNLPKQTREPIKLGHLVQSGLVLNGENGIREVPVFFGKELFNRHIFVTGVTGSGKTTTCQKLLLASASNFLVIEPAKTEYRIMAKDFPDMLVFTLGREDGAPFRLNPLEFIKGESIASRVDMLIASMNAAFDMEAAIPQFLEKAMYECYKDKGWSISSGKNRFYEDPFADGVYAFPTLSDLHNKIQSVVKEENFDERLRKDYIGSINGRLLKLTEGAKGLMLNTPRSINFIELLDKKVVLELDSIVGADAKSLIMGFVLANLSEAIKAKYRQNGCQPIEHLTLVEEAHRLLSKYQPGDSLNKKQGVEMFTDMLAEVRKYGESLIIADQIPNNLTPEVLKNTNTKIVHTIVAQDDKEAIGNIMALSDEQRNHLGKLNTGRAVLMMPGLAKAVQVQIEQSDENDTSRAPLADSEIRDRILDFYAQNGARGILPGLEQCGQKPHRELVRLYFDEIAERIQPGAPLVKRFLECVNAHKLAAELVEDIRALRSCCVDANDRDLVFAPRRNDTHCSEQIYVRPLCNLCFPSNNLRQHPEIYTYVAELIDHIVEEGKDYKVDTFPHQELLSTTCNDKPER